MKLKSALLLGLMMAVFAPLQAATLLYGNSNLNGLGEAPPNTSTGVGSTLITIDDVANTMRVEVSFSGLVGLSTNAHIHIGRPTGGVVTTTPTFPGFPNGVTAGFYDQVFDLLLALTYNPAFLNNATNGGSVATARNTFLAGLASGNAYLNIHSAQYPGGEIRGFLAPVPEPATFVMAGGALAALTLLRRRGSRA